jgi:hypothetical protein
MERHANPYFLLKRALDAEAFHSFSNVVADYREFLLVDLFLLKQPSHHHEKPKAL